MYRFLTALFVLACLSMSGVALADECTSKDAFRAMITSKYPEVISTDLNGEHEQMFLRGLSKLSGQDVSAYDAMLFRNPGFKTTLVMLFKDGCANLQAEFPNNEIAEIIGTGV
jgi:hypothetical protein